MAKEALAGAKKLSPALLGSLTIPIPLYFSGRATKKLYVWGCRRFWCNECSRLTFNKIAKFKAEFLIALGDLSYNESLVQNWSAKKQRILAPQFPFELFGGIHDEGSILEFAKALPDLLREKNERGYGV
ncbi:MAG: hypothetical protein KGJ48_17740 [Nitrospirota bacterium]|nr:hypothetical protein [Nitrospirota bacterium]